MRKTIATIALTAIACGTLHANDIFDTNNPNVFDYNFVEGSFVHRNNIGNGINTNASYDIKPNIAIIGGISYSSKDNASYTTLSVGAAYHQQIIPEKIPGLDLVIHAQLEDSLADYNASNVSDLGIRLGGGVRYLVMPKLEAFGDLSLATTGSSQIFIKGGVRYSFLDNLAGVASYEFSDNNALSLGVRYYF